MKVLHRVAEVVHLISAREPGQEPLDRLDAVFLGRALVGHELTLRLVATPHETSVSGAAGRGIGHVSDGPPGAERLRR